MINKKSIIAVSATVLIILVIILAGIYYMNLQADNQVKAQVKSVASNFVNKWANFQNQYSPSYIKTIEPYLTENKIKEVNLNAQTIGASDIKYGLTPTSSSFSNQKIKSLTKSNGTYTVKISGNLKFSDNPASSANVADVFLIKVGKKWFVSNVYFEN